MMLFLFSAASRFVIIDIEALIEIIRMDSVALSPPVPPEDEADYTKGWHTPSMEPCIADNEKGSACC
jgi:hypothetical protein